MGLIVGLIFPQHGATRPTQDNTIPRKQSTFATRPSHGNRLKVPFDPKVQGSRPGRPTVICVLLVGECSRSWITTVAVVLKEVEVFLSSIQWLSDIDSSW